MRSARRTTCSATSTAAGSRRPRSPPTGPARRVPQLRDQAEAARPRDHRGGRGAGDAEPGTPAQQGRRPVRQLHGRGPRRELGARRRSQDDLDRAAPSRPGDLMRTARPPAAPGVRGAVGALRRRPTTANSDRYLLYLEQGGLGLPDESYYREDSSPTIRAGVRRPHRPDARRWPASPTPTARAGRVMALETRLAAAPLGPGPQPRRRHDLQRCRPGRRCRSWLPASTGPPGSRASGAGVGARRGRRAPAGLPRGPRRRRSTRSRSRTGRPGWPGASSAAARRTS